eukprot:scaffold96_cov77-Skeletonema_dohrnii-CCMP3373.AAC.5
MDRPVKRAVGRKQKPYGNNQTVGRNFDWRKYAKMCSAEGCSNQAKKGGVCIRHGAKVKVKRCSSEGCTNQAQNGGVCCRHGASRTPCDGSTTFGSEYEKTTATLTLPSTANAGMSNERSTGEVVICQEIVEV